MVLVKNLKIFHLFIFGKMREENVFDDILERKQAFLDYKKEEVKKVKNWITGIAVVTLVTRIDKGWWDKVNDSMTGIPVATRMARVTMMNL